MSVDLTHLQGLHSVSAEASTVATPRDVRGGSNHEEISNTDKSFGFSGEPAVR